MKQLTVVATITRFGHYLFCQALSCAILATLRRSSFCLVSFMLLSLAQASDADRNASQHYAPKAYLAHPQPNQLRHQNVVILELDDISTLNARAYGSSEFQPESLAGKIGYFDPSRQYHYDHKTNYFVMDKTLKMGDDGAWDGAFLNWLVMSQSDLVRFLVLGHPGQALNQDAFVSAANFEQVFRSNSSEQYSPIKNGRAFSVVNGHIELQHTQYRIRLKERDERHGLVSLLKPAAEVYFFSKTNNESLWFRPATQYLSGDESALTAYLERQRKAPLKYYKESASASLLNNVIRQIQPDLKSKSSADYADLCQRYVHIKFSQHLPSSPLPIAEQEDCLPEMSGKQGLASFHWTLVSRSDSQRDNLSDERFLIEDIDRLARRALGFLSKNSIQSFVVGGVDVEYFPDGSGLLYQSLSRYSIKTRQEEVNWVGDLVAMFIDQDGQLRSDNGDGVLGGTDEDPVVSACHDPDSGTQRYQLSTELNPEASCNALNYPFLNEDIGFVWKASEQMGSHFETHIGQQRLHYRSDQPRRFIRTHIGQKEYDFVANDSYPVQPEWLNLSSLEEARKLINYTRGEPQQGARSKQVNGQTQFFGDFTHSAPKVVGRPNANFHLLYDDQSYVEFMNRYAQRPTRIFQSGHGGMIHSFHAGTVGSQVATGRAIEINGNRFLPGQETWAFVPFGVLPFLSELRKPSYGISPYHHLNLLNQAPYVFDAKVFGPYGLKGQDERLHHSTAGGSTKNSRLTHPGGWGTLMVVGFGSGGGSPTVGQKKTQQPGRSDFEPAYLVFDITDAYQAPKFIASVKVKDLGSSSSLPSVVTLKNSQGDLEWFLAFGSGNHLDPNGLQAGEAIGSAKIFLVNLRKLQDRRKLAVKEIDLKQANTSVVGVASADWDLNGETDAIYVNTTEAGCYQVAAGQCRGSIFRISPKAKKGIQGLVSETLIEVAAPLIERPLLSLDRLQNRWIYAASGQNTAISLPAKRVQHRIIGVKEPRDSLGRYLVNTTRSKSGTVKREDLLDVSDINVEATTGRLSERVNVSPQLDEQTVFSLEKRLMAFKSPTAYVHGWLKNLAPNELALTQANLMGGMITQPTFQHLFSHCLLNGQPFLQRLRYTTGTAWVQDLNHQAFAEPQAAWLTTQSELLGSQPSVGTLLHLQRNGVQLIHINQSGTAESHQDTMRDIQKSGEVSWRTL